MKKDILLGAANRSNVKYETINTDTLISLHQPISLITIDVDEGIDGKKGRLDIVYNKETKEFELEVYNARIEEGAKQLFEYVRELSGEFITNALKEKESQNE